MKTSIALVGDYNQQVIAHQAIPRALELACKSLQVDVNWTWVETTAISKDADNLNEFAAIWLVPASPYTNMEGALSAVQLARETDRPFLGTCGGFQHSLIEYARNVCHVNDADHAETASNNVPLIVTPLSCSLVQKTGLVSFVPGSRLHAIFQGHTVNEGYHCNYGLNPDWKNRLELAGIRFTGFDTENDIRAFELPQHPFFIGTLFQPERSALRSEQHPLINAFVHAASRSKAK